MHVVPGSIVAWWNGGALAFACVTADDGARVRAVRENGRECRFPASRIAAVLPERCAAPAADQESRRAAGRGVAEAGDAVRAQAESIDVALVWEVWTESDDERVASLAELAELASGGADGRAQAAVAHALAQDAAHFARRGDGFAPRPHATVRELVRQREIEATRHDEREALVVALAKVGSGGAFEKSGSEIEQATMRALEAVALLQDRAGEDERALTSRALDAGGLRWERPHEGAFRLLRLLGRFDGDDENLEIVRLGLSRAFPRAVLDRAEAFRSRAVDVCAGRERVASSALSIDAASTREIDDVITVERDGDLLRLGVHIADPSAFVAAGDVVDEEAARRALTHYMPDARIPMLPPALSEDAASLVPGQDRPAVSFRLTIGPDGDVVDREIARTVVRSAGRLDYHEADEAMRSGEGPHAALLAALDEVGRRREAARLASGAMILVSDEVDIYVGADGTPTLERLAGLSPARRAVTEAMVAAGAAAAAFCVERGVPAIFRRQASAGATPPAGAKIDDPIALRRMRRTLRRAETGLEPGRHASLALEAYVQVSSPIRRYQDLVMHRQLVAELAGEAPPLDRDALQRIAVDTERAEREARGAERRAEAYWLLRWLECNAGSALDAVVVETEPRPIVLLERTMSEHPCSAARGLKPGERVRLRVERVNPRAGVLALSRVE